MSDYADQLNHDAARRQEGTMSDEAIWRRKAERERDSAREQLAAAKAENERLTTEPQVLVCQDDGRVSIFDPAGYDINDCAACGFSKGSHTLMDVDAILAAQQATLEQEVAAERAAREAAERRLEIAKGRLDELLKDRDNRDAEWRGILLSHIAAKEAALAAIERLKDWNARHEMVAAALSERDAAVQAKAALLEELHQLRKDAGYDGHPNSRAALAQQPDQRKDSE